MTTPEARRWEAAWRSTPLPSGRRDPENGSRRYYRAPVGIGARTFREGFARGGRDALRRVWCAIPEEHRETVAAIAADYEEDND